MPKLLAPFLLVLATSACAQTSWTGDGFTVTTDNGTEVSVTGGSVQVQGMPYLLGLSNPGANLDQGPARFDLAFAPLPGHALLGEEVSFQLYVQVGSVGVPADIVVAPSGTFTIDVDGVYTISETDGAGTASAVTRSYFLGDPNLVARVGASTQEGLACPVGHEANGCGFGVDWINQDALVELSAVTATPLLAAVPEPATAGLCAAALAAFALVASRRRASRY